MRSKTAVFSWEYWRIYGCGAICALSGICGLMVLMYSIVRYQSGNASIPAGIDKPFFIVFFFMKLLCGGFVLLYTDKYANTIRIGFPYRLYTLPVPTWKLVGIHMFLGISTFILMSLAIDGLFILLFGGIPALFAPTLFLVTCLICAYVIVWSLPDFTMLRVLFFMFLLFIIGYAYDEYDQWTNINSAIVILMAVSIIAFYFLAVLGVARDRRGDSQGWPELKAWFEKKTNLLPRRRVPITSPAAAQFWFEWRRKGFWIPIIIGGVQFIFIFSYMCGWLRPDEMFRDLFIFAFGVSVYFLPFAAGAVGNLGSSAQTLVISTFRATRPMSDQALSKIYIKICAAIVLTILAINILAIGLAVILMYLFGDSGAIGHVIRPFINEAGIPLYLFVLLIICCIPFIWAVMCLGASLIISGRNGLVATVLIGFFGTMIVFMFSPAPIQRISPYFIGMSFMIGTVWAYVAACRRGFIGIRTSWLAFGGWLALSGLALYIIPLIEIPEPAAIILTLGLLALLFAPFATTPLALSWNRHR